MSDKMNWKLLFMYKKDDSWKRTMAEEREEILSVCHKKSPFIQFVLFFFVFPPFQPQSNYLQAAVFNIDSVVSARDFHQSLWKHLMKHAKQV